MMGKVSLRIAVIAAVIALAAGCGESESSTKAGSTTAPVTLRVGTEDPAGRATEGQIDEFARHVRELSGGSVLIEPVYRAAGSGFPREWDQIVARKVVSGELEMGLVPARAWDTEGVTSMRALNAPFLVTSDALVSEVVTSELAEVMLAGLDDVGVTGLGLLPEGMRRVFVFGDGDTSPFDLDGTMIRAPRSATTFAVFKALGAQADDFNGDEVDAGVSAGTIHGAETSFELARTLPKLSVASGGEALFAKVNSLVVNTTVFDRLSSEQQDALRTAAARAVEWSIGRLAGEVAAAEAFCAGGGTVVEADAATVEAWASAVAPVYADLEADEVTRTLIERIRAMKSELPAAPGIEPCGPPAPNEGEAPSFDLAGVYRQDVTVEHLVSYGVSDAKARQEAGVQTWTLEHGGEFVLEYQDNVCRGTYQVADDRVTFRWTSGCNGDWSMTPDIRPDGIAWAAPELLGFDSPEFLAELEAFTSVPWIRVGDAEPPEGA